MDWLVVGPTALSGIGQVTSKYASLLTELGNKVEYVEIGQKPTKTRYDRGFAFILPIAHQMAAVDFYTGLCRDMMYMTVCETEPVNEAYELVARFKKVWCPSEFSRRILARQFPECEWKLLHHWSESKIHRAPTNSGPYIFYTIGNIMDPRKNIRRLIEAYLRCEFKDAAHLVLKATCNQPVNWKVPGVTVINGLLSESELEQIHTNSHCYVNFSHSEGVGMGAVEAALRSKPVIITDYGGLKEYVRTPWVVPCTVGPIGFDDFLFKKDHTWGHPSNEVLQKHMWDCFSRKVSHWDHSHTTEIMQSLRRSLGPDSCSGGSCSSA
jgi:glycosyltransferase involved in cell wall biosynthesis